MKYAQNVLDFAARKGITPEEAAEQLFRKPGFARARPRFLPSVATVKQAIPVLGRTGLWTLAGALGLDRISEEYEKTRQRVAGPFAEAYEGAGIEPLTIAEALNPKDINKLPERLQVSPALQVDTEAGEVPLPPEWQVALSEADKYGAIDLDQMKSGIRIEEGGQSEEEALAQRESQLRQMIEARDERIRAMVEGLGPGTDELKAQLTALDDERQEALRQLEEYKPERPTVDKGERGLAFLQGAAGGAAGIGNEYQVGRILAGAGSGGLGGIAARKEEERGIVQEYEESMRRFQLERAGLLTQIADSKAADIIRIHAAEQEDAKMKLNAQLEASKAVDIRLDTQNGKAFVFDPITGEHAVIDIVPYDMLLARSMLTKALGGNEVQVINDHTKSFKISPVMQPYYVAASKIMEGYDEEFRAKAEARLQEKMSEDQWDLMQAQMQMGNEDQERMYMNRLHREIFNMLVESGDPGAEYVKALNEKLFGNQSDVYRMLEELRVKPRLPAS